MSTFGEVLAEFKSKEEPENIVSLLDDEQLRQGIVAWKSVVVRYKALCECTHKDEASRWRWLWEQVEYNQEDFGMVAGVKVQDVGKLLTRLKGLRLIYPDGTIHKLAKNYLQATIMEKLKSLQPKEKKKDREPMNQGEDKKL